MNSRKFLISISVLSFFYFGFNNCYRLKKQFHKDKFYKDAGISRRALFKLMEPNANPTLDSLAKVCRALVDAA
jgi:hypothetical protein